MSGLVMSQENTGVTGAAPRRAAIYARISDARMDHQGARETGGVERQEKDCRDLAARRGWVVGEVYVDNNVSAYSPQARPEWTRLLADLKAGKSDGLVVYDLDRVARRPRDLEDLLDLVTATGVPILNVTGELDLTTSSGQVLARVLVAFATKSSQDTGRRVKRKHQDSADKGLPHGSSRPFGFLDDRRTPHPIEAPIAQEAVARFLAGETLRGIALDFRKRDLPTARTGVWAPQNLRAVLRRPAIGGLHYYKGEDTGHRFVGLVDEKQWRAVQAILDDPSRRVSPGPPRRHLLSGFCRCGVCGEVLRVKPRHSGHHAALACEKRLLKDQRHPTRSLQVIEALVVETVLRWLEEFDFARTVATDQANDYMLDEQIRNIDVEIKGWQGEVIAGRAGRETAAPILSGLQGQLDNLRQQRNGRLRSSALTPFVGTSARSTWEAADLEQRRAVLGTLIHQVVVEPTDYRGPAFDFGAVRLEWITGEAAEPSTGQEAWITNALAAAPDADGLARVTGEVLGMGVLLENPWTVWPGVMEVA